MECSTFPQSCIPINCHTVSQSFELGNIGYEQRVMLPQKNRPHETITSQNSRIRPNSILARMALPCQSSSSWDYQECYSYYANGCYNTCQFVEFCDIEDFM